MTTVANKITRNTWYGAYSFYRKHKKLFAEMEKTYFEDDAAYIKAKREYDEAHSRWLDYAVDAIKKDTDTKHGLGLVIDEMCRYAHTKEIDLSAFTTDEILRARLRGKLPKQEFNVDYDNLDFFAPLYAQQDLEAAHAAFFTPRITQCRNVMDAYEAKDKALLTSGLSLSQIVWLHVTDNIQYGLFSQSRNDAPARELP